MASDSTTVTNPPKKGPGGRPTKYDPNLLPQIEKICTLYGSTDQQLAQFLEVDVTTIDEWKIAYPEFFRVLKNGKRKYDDANVEASLAKRASGFMRTVERLHEGVPVACLEEVPPDTTACIFWLKNRQSKDWRDKQEHELSGKDGAPITPIINISVGSLGAKDEPEK